MFWVDFRNNEQLNWFVNVGMKLCRWKQVDLMTDIHRQITHIAVKPIGLFGIIGWFKAKSHLYQY